MRRRRRRKRKRRTRRGKYAEEEEEEEEEEGEGDEDVFQTGSTGTLSVDGHYSREELLKKLLLVSIATSRTCSSGRQNSPHERSHI